MVMGVAVGVPLMFGRGSSCSGRWRSPDLTARSPDGRLVMGRRPIGPTQAGPTAHNGIGIGSRWSAMMYGYDGYGMSGWMWVWGATLTIGVLVLIGGLVWAIVASTTSRRSLRPSRCRASPAFHRPGRSWTSGTPEANWAPRNTRNGCTPWAVEAMPARYTRRRALHLRTPTHSPTRSAP